ncbi:heterokaryon incompatibility protein-domain-containing protein [Hypoxylon cercidicola]|nr:heterokaryon incompatibility protein-domain-containing protein [Hypoxylon cercidicola]
MSRPLYYWKLFSYYLTIPLGILGLRGWRVSFGICFHFVKDRKITPIEVPLNSDGELEVYEYKPLEKGTIRLLQLEPGAYGDPLWGRLVHIDLVKAQQQYMTVSYEECRPNVCHRIRIGNACLQVWDNLDSALRAVRSEDRAVTLWVDALCINQADIAEKTDQVRLMPEIFSGATDVHSWLGDATAASPVGMEILWYLLGDGPFDDGAPWHRRPASEVAQGLGDIIDRVYLQRIWIVQEAAFGRRVTLQVGHLSVTWEAPDTRRFLTRIKLLEVSPLWTSPQFPAVDFKALRELLEQSSKASTERAGHAVVPTLLDIVHTMRHLHSTDPRDKIYGLMGLAVPADVAGFAPDYKMSWEETYRKFYEHTYAAALKDPDQTLEERVKEGPSSSQVSNHTS